MTRHIVYRDMYAPEDKPGSMLERLPIDYSQFDMDAVGRASVRKVYGSLPPELYGNVDYSYMEESDEKEWQRFRQAVRDAGK